MSTVRYPAHWTNLKLKYVASLRSGEGITSGDISDIGEYPVYGGNGVRGYTSSHTHDGTYPLIGRQGALCGNINYASGKFWASEHAIVVNVHDGHVVRWLGEVLRSMNLNQYSQSAAQPGISVEVIENLLIPVPPEPEQGAIANYLDRETARIDGLIAEKERMLALLEEKRAALISRVVTRGLDPTNSPGVNLSAEGGPKGEGMDSPSSAPLKPSGQEWLGEIPTHWNLWRLKHLASEALSYGANEAALEDNPEWPRFVRITDIAADGSLRNETFKSLSPEIAEPFLLDDGDLLFARSGATVGKSFIYRPSWGVACFAGYLIRFRCDLSKALPDYLNLFAQSSAYWHQVSIGTIQATIQNFSAEKYADIIVPLPSMKAQQEIIDAMQKEQFRFDGLTSQISNSLALMKERRAALITAAVTGQIPLTEMG